eukprot:COSAG02_NODE_1744_length_11100_cov_6.084083_6_plen_71_part_00
MWQKSVTQHTNTVVSTTPSSMSGISLAMSPCRTVISSSGYWISLSSLSLYVFGPSPFLTRESRVSRSSLW